MASGPEPPIDHLQTSQRDQGELEEQLQAWFQDRPDVGPGATVVDCHRPEANGMSSDTLLFDTSEPTPSGPVARRYVARLAPAEDTCPIFPSYDLAAQVRVMRLVGEQTTVPVPRVHWYEPDPTPLGAPFFVMTRVDGEVPPDVMPYTFDDSWVQAASPAQRATMEARTIEVISGIHSVAFDDEVRAALDPSTGTGSPSGVAGAAGADGADGSALRRHFENERRYYLWARDGLSFPVLERAFDWLEARWPVAADEAPPVLCWGDARIGNIIFRDFAPVGVLDWEMATICPRELDLSWLILIHQFFEGITHDFGMVGLPDFLQRDAVASRYVEVTGHEPQDLEWFLVYAALRHGIVMTRAMRRRVLFGEVEMPDDPEEMILHRGMLEEMIR